MKQAKAEYNFSRLGVSELLGTKLDNAQYISLLFKGEAERIKDKVGLGTLSASGKKYHVYISGQPVITDSNGQSITKTQGELQTILEGGRESEINYDAMAYLEIEGETSAGKRYMGVYYSLADASKHIAEEAEKGEL